MKRNRKGLTSRRKLREFQKSEQRRRAMTEYERYRVVVEKAADFIYVVDKKNRVLSVNPSAATLLGRTPKEIEGKSIFDIFPGEVATEFSEHLGEVFKTGKGRLDPDSRMVVGGKEFWTSVRLDPILDSEGNVSAVLGVTRDITERKRMEERLSSLHQHALRLASATRMDEIVKYTLDTMQFTLGFDCADFNMVEDGLLVAKAFRGEMAFSVPLSGPGIVAKAAREKKSILVDDTRKEANYVDRKGPDWKGPPTILSEIATPVIIDGQTVAVLNVEHAQPNAFLEQDQMLLENLAAHVASEMKRLEHERQLENYSKELQRSSQFLGSIIENANVWLDVLDEEKNVVIWNQAAETMSGYSRGEVTGHRKIWDWLYPDEKYRKQITDSVTDILQHGRTEQDIETTIKRKDGETRIISWNERNFLDEHGNVIGSVAIGRDITERKRVEEELANERSVLRTLIDNLPDNIFVKDVESRFVISNLAHAHLLRAKTPDEIVGKTDFDIFPLELASSYYDDEQAVIQSGQPLLNREERTIDSEGKTRWLLTTKVPLRDDHGKVIGVAGINRDITEPKRMREELEQYSKRLEKLVEERTEKLRQAERLAAVGETAAMVGHDLRNPLQGITGAIHLLNQDSLTAKERSEMLQLIQDNVEYADAIVRDLSAYSAEIHLKLADTTPKSIVKEALRGVRVPREVKVHNVSEEHPTIKVDSDRMRRVFINLIENSIDAMPQGGTLTISSKQSDGTVEIALSDTGSGMPEKVMQNPWKPLQTTKAKGLGLGLAICKRIVDAHGGNISVKSKIGEGTTVTIRLSIKLQAVEVTQK